MPHVAVELKDAAGTKTHDYLLLSSPRKVKDKTTAIMLLARVPVSIELWPEGVDDHSYNLQVRVRAPADRSRATRAPRPVAGTDRTPPTPPPPRAARRPHREASDVARPWPRDAHPRAPNPHSIAA